MDDRKLSLVVGAFVLLILGAFALVILSLSAERGFYAEVYTVEARFENVQGLLENAPVWLAGKQIGRVEEVSFGEIGADKPMLVRMQLDTRIKERIRGDSIASIGTIGVLGDSYVEISAGSLGAEALGDGDEIEAITPANIGVLMGKAGALMNTGTEALESVAALAGNVNAVIAPLSSGEAAKRATATLRAMSEIVLAVQTGPGLLHSVIYDQYSGGGVESIERSLASLEQILREVKAGEGFLHTLIYDPVDENVIAQMLDSGTRMNRILEKIEAGEGTMGLLLNDPSLYEDLQILLGGAQRSAVVRSLIRLSTDTP